MTKNNIYSFPYEDSSPEEYKKLRDGLWAFVWSDADGTYPLGYVLDRVARELIQTPASIRGELEYDEKDRTVMFLHTYKSESERTEKLAGLTDYWRKNGTFKLLRGWRAE